MSTDRRLIVNADDFGYSPGINRGIIAAHENGIVTSTSLMVRWPDAAAAAAYARNNPRLSVGLHFDLGEWIDHDGQRRARYVVVPPGSGIAGYEAEARRQLDLFRQLLGREPSHLDSHQHIHLTKPLHPLFQRLSQEIGRPLRSLQPPIRYLGSYYARNHEGRACPERVAPEAIHRILAALAPGTSELGCHPAAEIDFESPYAAERLMELQALCDKTVVSTVAERGIHLISFHDIATAADSPLVEQPL